MAPSVIRAEKVFPPPLQSTQGKAWTDAVVANHRQQCLHLPAPTNLLHTIYTTTRHKDQSQDHTPDKASGMEIDHERETGIDII